MVGVARDGQLLGLIGIGDEIKADAAETIRRIRDAGMTPVMITGDNQRTARAVAEEVGIDSDDVLSEVLPDDKAAEVRRLQEDGQRVAMVGDGINDAPALTQSDVGFAIGAGTDIAIESADIVIMSERLGAVIDAHEIGVRSYRRTKQNLALAFAFNGIGVPAAATGFVHPVWAMIAMVASVTTVLGNSFRGQLRRRLSREFGRTPQEQLDEEHEREHDHGRIETAEGHGHADYGTEQPPAEHPEAPVEAAHRAHHATSGEQGSEQPDRDEGEGRTLRLRVPMHCSNCAERIEERLGTLEGVCRVGADHERDVVTVGHGTKVFEGQIRTRLHEMGFDVVGHANSDEATV